MFQFMALARVGKSLIAKVLGYVFIGFIAIIAYAYITGTAPEPLLNKYVSFLKSSSSTAFVYGKRGVKLLAEYGLKLAS